MKISLIIPVYYNQDNLPPLYRDIREKLYSHTEYEWEIVMVNDGSEDDSYKIMKELAAGDFFGWTQIPGFFFEMDEQDRRKIYELSAKG